MSGGVEDGEYWKDGVALAMLVAETEQDWPPRSPPAGASHDTLPDRAWRTSWATAGETAARVMDVVPEQKR